MENKLYDEKSIESLSPLEFTRLKPGVYVGDTTYSTQLLVEAVANSVDEFNLGHGDKILITIEDDNTISIRDYGQGFLINSLRPDGKTVLEAAFSVLNTSGKYKSDGVYEGTSLGAYGIGAKLIVFLSNFAEIKTFRDNRYEFIKFNEGVFESREVGDLKDNETGTLIRWHPSSEFFSNIEIEEDKMKKLLKTIACLCPGLNISFYDKGKKTTFVSKNGINDLVNDGVQGKEIIKKRFSLDFKEGKYRLNMVMTYSSNYSSTIVPYVNTGLTESGPHITQMKTIITRTFNDFFREKKWLKEKDENLTGDDIQEGMYLVFNMTAPDVGYDAQVKSRVVKLDMKPFSSIIANKLKEYCIANEKEIKGIAEKAINARKAREAAKAARDKARDVQKKKKEKALKFASKLADCYSKNRLDCEVYVVEGDSAAGNLKTARNNEFQAVIPVRGKILNCEKATITQIQKNAEIMTMLDAFGLIIDPKTLKVIYDKFLLRYGKIIIMSDADVDGSHIKNLFYTFIWNFCPDLILNGHIYAGVPPLYKITTSKGYKYLKDDAALDEYKKENLGKKYSVNRLKGLGEMSVEETEETLVDPNFRIIKQITAEDIVGADKLFEDLMGKQIQPRKEFVAAHSHEALYDI